MVKTARHHSPACGPQRQALRQWLARTECETLRVGGCGHLLLEDAERRLARQRLIEEILPRIAAMQPARISLFVGLAPGADMLLLKTVADWFTARGLRIELTALLPVPVEHLLHDWALRAQDSGRRVNALTRARIRASADTLLASCHFIVPLYAGDAADDQLGSRRFRQRQYRHLAALVAQHADVVVAVLREGASAEPGSTAEILQWRAAPQTIPADLRLRREHCSRRPLSIVIDPRADIHDTPSDDPLQRVLQQARIAHRGGNELLCFDLVRRAFDQGLRAPELDYLLIQALANSGDTAQALDHYRRLDLADEELDEDWLALRGRLEKDLGLHGGTAATSCFARAADAYIAAYRQYGGAYSGINAASMLMLAGRVNASRRLARTLLRQLEATTPDDPQARYYRDASLAEAALLLGKPEQCRAALRRANHALAGAPVPRSRTRRQLRQLCSALALDEHCLDALRLPPAVLLNQRGDESIPAAVEHCIRQGALLHFTLGEPQDLRFAEMLLQHGATLYLTLPAPLPLLARRWHGGSSLRKRLADLVSRVEGYSEQHGFLSREHAWALDQAHAMNRGLARLTAMRLGLPWRELGPASKNMTRPAAAPRRKNGRRMVGLLFADFASFRRLDDGLLPRYYTELMAPIAALIDRHCERVLVRKTWGDALHLVTVDASTAAQLALQIQRFIATRRRRQQDLLGDLELRIAAHYAPAYIGRDPVERCNAAYGTQLLFAARIEPVAPPGMIYVTENFAARLALEDGDHYALDYAGEVELAKRFGRYRLFALRAPRGESALS